MAAPARCVPVGLLRGFRLPRGIFADVESRFPEIPVLSRVWTPINEARIAADNFIAEERAITDRIFKGVRDSELTGVMGALISKDSAKGAALRGGSAKAVAKAAEIESYLAKRLGPQLGLDPFHVTQLLKDVMPQLRTVGGNLERLPNNIVPEALQPIIEDLRNGGMTFTGDNPRILLHQLIHTVSNQRFMSPIRRQAQEFINEIRHKGGKRGLEVAAYAQDFVDSQVNRDDAVGEIAAGAYNFLLSKLNKVGLNAREVDQADVRRWASNAASWYSGLAMSLRPALAIRDATQVFLPGIKVGYDRLGPAIKKVYGKGATEFRAIATRELGLRKHQLFETSESESVLGKRWLRNLKKLQDAGQFMREPVERVNNRMTTFWMGHDAITTHAPAYLEGKATLDEFLHKTGLAGSAPADREQILSFLRGETVDVTGAAKTYGKMLVDETQFIYGRSNLPMNFQGTAGKLFGQFGVWPIAFTEMLAANLRHGTRAYRQTYLTRYAAQVAAFNALGAAAGIDTSDWNFSNPLTFQGGPYTQFARELSVLASSPNEYERRGARSYLRRFMSQIGNPFGGVSTDIIQAKAEEDPVAALRLLLGFSPRQEAR